MKSKKMLIFITGGSGLIGSILVRRYLDKGCRVTATGTRARHPMETTSGRFRYIPADTTAAGSWQEEVRKADAVINLAGKNVFTRWSRSAKKALYDSRILTTRRVVEAISGSTCSVLCSTSAVGYYGNRGDNILREKQGPGDGFIASLAVAWEAEAKNAEQKGIRVVIPRFGIVLEKNGGALKKMLPAFKAFAGGPVGDGQQWVPWIHMEDLVSALETAVSDSNYHGTFNFTAPNPAQNKDLAKAIGRALHRPAAIPVPAFILKLMFGEMAVMLLASHRAVPEKLLSGGFRFRYTELDDAVKSLIRPSSI